MFTATDWIRDKNGLMVLTPFPIKWAGKAASPVYHKLRQKDTGNDAACQSLSLWERCHCEAMTERASPSPGSRHAAMGRLFVRAILSQCQSCLAASLPSQSGLRPPAPPKGEPLACRSGFHWTSKARCPGNGSAPLSRPATA